MGYFLGQRIPDNYNPFWEEPEYADQPDHWKWYHVGWEDGYAEGSASQERIAALEQENQSLRELMAANVRVIRAEIRKQIEEENRNTR